MTYKRYEKYKYSGIDWIGEVPAHWNIGGMTKYIDNIVDYRGKTPEKVKEGIFLVTAKNIKDGVINYDNSKEYVKYDDYEEVMKRGKPKIGEVLFTTEAPLGEVANVDNENIALAQRIIKFSSNKQKLNNYFLKYWILSNGFQNNLKSLATGSTAEGIKSSKLFNLKVVLPTISEQETIVRFLDSNISKIDSLIEEKEKLIKLLKEKREAIITEAVTKGVDKNVKMKNSGVEWIGDIPINWEISRLKFTTDKPFMYGANESAELDDKSLPRYIRITDIDEEGCLKKDTFKSMEYEKAKEFLLNDKDILFARSGATVGKTYLYNLKDGSACFAGYLIKYTHNYKVIPEFIYYITKSSWYSCWINQNTIQATIQNVSADKYKNLYIPLPDILEQGRIVDFLSKKCNEIKLVITDIKNQINELRNYKKSLISEVVTGKIDVRDCKG